MWLLPNFLHRVLKPVCGLFLVCLMALSLWPTASAWAGLKDDNYDGNIFALYAGNGAIVPPVITVAQSLKQKQPAILFLYVDDSSDCKSTASVISQLQAPYGKAANFVPIMVDGILPGQTYGPTDPGFYFKNVVPQTVVFDGTGKVRFNKTGAVSYEEVDDVLRDVFNLLPRSESVELRRRSVNEINTELVPQ
jgi:hypothetical protein